VCDSEDEVGDLFDRATARLLDYEGTFHRDCAVERADGETVQVEFHGGLVQCGGDPGCLVIVWDR
jgi:hypothetical protein